MQKIPQEWIERAARVYASNQEASKALGIAGGTFGRLCRLYDIETPFARQRRRRPPARSRSREVEEAAELEDAFDLEDALDLDEMLESAL